MKALLTLALFLSAAAAPVFADTGYGGGYAWKSGADTTYSWIDISTTGTQITGLSDDNYSIVTTPFDISFFGDLHAAGSDFYVGSNGMVGFTSNGMSKETNQNIPNATTPNDLFALFWDDLHGGYTGANCRHKTFGTAPNRYWVISYHPYYRFGHAGDSIAFEIIIYENDGTFDNAVKMQFKDVVCGDASEDYGASATVGLENASGTSACKYSYNSVSLSNAFAIYYQDVKPTAFDLLEPADGAVINVFPVVGRVLVNTDFVWEESTTPAPGNITYDLYIDNNADFSSPEYEVTDLTDESATVGFEVNETITYYWRVIATEDQAGKERQCAADFHFTFNYNGGTTIAPVSLGEVKATFR